MPDALPTLTGTLVSLAPLDPSEVEPLALSLTSDPLARTWFGHDKDTVHRWLSGPEVGAFAIRAIETPMHGPLGIITFEEESDPDYFCAGIDIGLLSQATGQGLGPDALRTLIRWLFDERGHHRVAIDPAVANHHAVHVYRKVGFRPVGVMRSYERGPDGWHDNLLMDMLRGELT